MCALVVGVYAYIAHEGGVTQLSLNAADSSYNSLVQGFRVGQLSLKKEVPVGLAQLADPYDPVANQVYRFSPSYLMHDLSYYKGRLYLYFGVTQALILFWPFVALTGHYLSHRVAVLVFCSIGFLASVGVQYAAWRRYFSEVSAWVLAACALALGLATLVPVMLSQCDVYEVAVSCGYMLTMLSLGAIWCALHEPERRCWWLAAASAAYGLAVGARPSLLFGAIILLVPVTKTWYEQRRIGAQLLAATGPIILIGLGLMLYNVLRFNNPFEFGEHYQLAGARQVTPQFFSLHYLWFNFRVYFLEAAHWSARFPFVHKIATPPLPVGYEQVEFPFGILTNIPFVWLAAAVPLAWRGRLAPEASRLRWFAAAAALLFGICALAVGLFWAAVIRYEVDFLPALVLLAVIGILSLERALAGQPVWRRAARWGWSALLSFSVAFNLLASIQVYAGRQCALGVALAQVGRVPEAIQSFREALRLDPDFPEAHDEWGRALERSGRAAEAVEHYQQAVLLRPDYVAAQVNLGNALLRMDNLQDAIAHFEQALRIKPHDADAHFSLANAFLREGKFSDAIEHYEQALQINPDYSEAHDNLGLALARWGMLQEAIAQFEQALRIKPDNAETHNNLAVALARLGRMQEAVGHWEQALRIKPDDADAHYNSGVALAQLGRTREAIAQYQQALRINPDFVEAQNALARLQAGQ